MSVDSDAFKKLKPKAKDEIVKRFNDIESELNVKIQLALCNWLMRNLRQSAQTI